MNKRKLKIPTMVIILVLLILTAVAATIAYAYNYFVNYNYNAVAHADLLSYSVNGTTITVTRENLNQSLVATKADIILLAALENVTVGGKEPSHTVKYGNLYKMAFTDLELSGEVTNFTVSTEIDTLLKAAVSEAEFTENSRTVTVSYTNSYVTSFRDLELLNLQSNYNNIFELAGHYYSDIVIARVVYLLSDITISNDFTINFPCSIDILDTTLTIDGNLLIHHSCPGSYYIEASGGGEIVGSSDFTVKIPKAYCRIDNNIITNYDGILSRIFDYNSYGDLLIDDALDFVERLIPKRVYRDLVLQQFFQTHGVAYTYFTVNGGTETPFSGRVSSLPTKNGILRASENSEWTIRVYAEKGSIKGHKDIKVCAIGTSVDAVAEVLVEVIDEDFSQSFYSNIDLMPLINNAYDFGVGALGDITFSISENAALGALDENAAKLYLNGIPVESRTVTITFDYSAKKITTLIDSNIVDVNSLYMKRGTVAVSKSVYLLIEAGAATPLSCTFDQTLPAISEILYYLKSSSPVFLSSLDYPLLSIDALSGIYLGDTLITSSTFNISKIEYELIECETIDGVTTEYALADGTYFVFDPVDKCLRIVEGLNTYDLPEQIFVRYTVTLEGGAEHTYVINMLRTLAEDGSDSQQFESSNPFDELFVSAETNWLEGGEFAVPASASAKHMYARIEILTVGGVTYVPGYAYNMCAIENGTATIIGEGINYYKRIKFITYLKYVPDKNTAVKVKCIYYNNATESDGVVFTQEYTVIIPGVFKCGTTALTTNETSFVFTDLNFYNMTIELFEDVFGDNAKLYVSTFSTGVKLLLSSSANAKLELDYTRVFDIDEYGGSGMVLTGMQRLKNVTVLILDDVPIMDMSAFSLMADSGLLTLSMERCGLTDALLWISSSTVNSYIYPVHLLNVSLAGNRITRTDNLIGRTVRLLDLSGQMSVMGQQCLVDIAGLISAKDLEDLDITNNAIYSFEVLKFFEKLKTVYLFNNRLSDAAISDAHVIGNTTGFTVFGTNGLINVPNYVWVIKTRNVLVFANKDNINANPGIGAVGYIQIDIDALPSLFSTGGKITAEMLEGSVGLNAFASPERIYAGGQGLLENDIMNLVVRIGDGGGVGDGPVSDYYFAFFNPLMNYASSRLILLRNRVTVTVPFTATISNPVIGSYVVAIIKNGTIIAMREFVVNWHCGYDYSHVPYNYV